MTLVYIASPYSFGDQNINVWYSMGIGDELIKAGITPVMPLLFHFFDQAFPHSYETYMRMSFEMLSRCDALLRLPGVSAGADRECIAARKSGIPIFHDIDKLIKWHKESRHVD